SRTAPRATATSMSSGPIRAGKERAESSISSWPTARITRCTCALRNELLARLSVEVIEGLEPGDEAQAAPEDLVGARVVADVVRVLRAVGEIGQPVAARAEAVGDARTGRPSDDVAGAQRVRLPRLRRGRRTRLRRAPELERSVAPDHAEHLLVGRIAVRRSALLVRRKRDPVEPGLACSARGADPLRDTAEIALDIVKCDDVRCPPAGLAVRYAELRLGGPGMRLEHLHGRVGEPCDIRARQHARLGSQPLTEDEHLETVVAADQRVRRAPGVVDDRVAGGDRACRAVLPERRRTAEHVEDLLFDAVLMRWRDHLARREAHAMRSE